MVQNKYSLPATPSAICFYYSQAAQALFRFDRKLLGKLSQYVYQPLKEFFQTTLNRKETISLKNSLRAHATPSPRGR